MGLEIKLSPQQIKAIANNISFKDIQDYINSHQEEYEQFLREEQKKERTR